MAASSAVMTREYQVLGSPVRLGLRQLHGAQVAWSLLKRFAGSLAMTRAHVLMLLCCTRTGGGVWLKTQRAPKALVRSC